MKLLVGSTYCNSPRNETWYRLQKEYLAKTTTNYDHFVIITQDTDYKIFDTRILKVLPKGYYKKVQIHGQKGEFSAHLEACNLFLDHYRNNDYTHLLILDSDCFPIMKGWQEFLLEKMGSLHYAAPFRAENFDLYPHPLAFFLKDKEWKWSFMPDKWIVNPLGQRFIDTGSTLDMRHCYPLLRSNTYNPHPIFAGIYHDIFYHHCCGSRIPKTRTITKGYFDHYVGNHEEIEKKCYEELTEDSDKFINKLRGAVCET